MVTLKDVADRAGLSPMTVSNALRGKTNVSPKSRERARRAAEELGYRVNVVAQSLRSGRTGTIALAVPELDMPFPAHYAAEVTAAAARKGLRVIVQQTHSKREAELAIIRDGVGGLADGTIISALGMTDDDLMSAAKGKAVVLMDERPREAKVDIVCSPNYDGAHAAVKHLINQGCESIVILGVDGATEEGQSPKTGDGLRLAGARLALEEAGLPFDPTQAVHCEWTAEAARDVVGNLIRSQEKFDGIFALTDSIAIGALRALADHDVSCPGEVKVIGFDGIREGEFTVPSLTTIDIDKVFMAEAAVDMLLQQIDSKNPDRVPEKKVASYRLVARESTEV